MLLALALALVLAPARGSVELGPDAWRRLHPPTPAEAALPAWAATRSVHLLPVDGGVRLRATWTLRALSPETWFSGQLLAAIPGMRIEQVTWNGKTVAARTTPDGLTVADRVTGSAVLELVAFLPGEPTRAPLAFTLLPAVRGHVEVLAPAGLAPVLRAVDPAGPQPVPNDSLEPSSPPRAVDPAGPQPVPNDSLEPSSHPRAVDPAGPQPVPNDSLEPSSHPQPAPPIGPQPVPNDSLEPPPRPALPIGPVFWTGAARLDLAFTPAVAPGARQTLVVARAGLGLTVGDAELRGRARLVWEVRQGSIDAVEFTAADTGPDLDIQGTGVRAVQRSGDAVRVELQAPVAGRLELAATWTAPLAKTAESRAPLPRFDFAGVFRSESSLQLARDGEVEAVPDLAGWTPTAAAALPAWGQGLVEGAPTAAYRGGSQASGALDLLRFVPIEGPPVVIDVAAYTIATSREGRAIIRAHYEVRNERAATLRVRPPPGLEILGVRVAGTTATPARGRDGAWHVPLQRSVETVSGALSFPVEIALLGGSVPWDRRERRALQLPQLDAPVAVARVTLHLPPGYRSRHAPGDADVVAAFTRGDGITYGLGVGAVGAAEADATFQSAVKHWLANDFDAAQADLDDLRAMGASNENITRLQGNLDVIAGRGDRDDRGVQRRIREQARARSIDDARLQDELRAKADESRKAGDYEAAQSQYKAAIAVGDRLAKLEQKESVEQQSRNASLARELESTAGEFNAKQRIAGATKKSVPPRAVSKLGTLVTTPEEQPPDAGETDEPGPTAATTEEARPADPAAGTTREHTTIVDVAPTATRDAPDPLAATPGAFPGADTGSNAAPEPPAPVQAVDQVQVQSVSRAAPGVALVSRIGQRLRNRRSARPADSAARGPHTRSRDALDTKFKQPPTESAAPAQDVLPEPKVTASAVSVVVPQVGQAVLYQRLLLPADAVHAIDVSAREPLLAKD